MSKGSARRKEDTEKVRQNWDAIFGKKEKPQGLAEEVFNDIVDGFQKDVERKLIEGQSDK
jgi:hypothetical protein